MSALPMILRPDSSLSSLAFLHLGESAKASSVAERLRHDVKYGIGSSARMGTDEVLARINQLVGDDWDATSLARWGFAPPRRDRFYEDHAEALELHLRVRGDRIRRLAQRDPKRGSTAQLLVATSTQLCLVDPHHVDGVGYEDIRAIKLNSSLLSRYSGAVQVEWAEPFQLNNWKSLLTHVEHLEKHQAKDLCDFVAQQLSSGGRQAEIEAAAREFWERASEQGFMSAWLTRGHPTEKERTEFIANMLLEAGSRRVKQKYNLSDDEMMQVIREAFKGLR